MAIRLLPVIEISILIVLSLVYLKRKMKYLDIIKLTAPDS